MALAAMDDDRKQWSDLRRRPPITAEKEAAATLERAQRQTAHLQKMDAIGQLTGGIAHDFNDLLMIVSGHAQGLKSRLKEARDTRPWRPSKWRRPAAKT